MNFSTTTKLSVLAFFAFATLNSCKKEKDDEQVTPEAVATFEVASPEEGKEYHHGMEIPITIAIAATSELHGYEVTLTNTTTNEVVFEVHQHAHSQNLLIDESWINNVEDHSSMVLQVDAVIDHDGTIESKTVSFHCHPEMGGTH